MLVSSGQSAGNSLNSLNSRQALGVWGEKCAAAYLQNNDYEILESNWRIRGGEIDIIAYDPQRQAAVAVEVKTRRQRKFGTPEEAITEVKLCRLRSLLIAWVSQQKNYWPHIAVDCIGIEIRGREYTLRHMKDLPL